jgi:DNA-directed RNA polymerase
MQSCVTLASREELRLRLIDEQKRWEVDCADAGARRYREANAELTLDQTLPGTTVLRQTVPPLARAVAALQQEAEAGIAEGGRGRNPEWWWLVTQLDAEKLALLVLRATLSTGSAAGRGRDRQVTSLALVVADGIKLQMEHERWVAQEREQTKAAKRAGVERPDLLAALKSRVKRVDARAWKRWTQKIGQVRDEPWPVQARLVIGTLLLETMVRVTEGWFEVILQPVPGGKTEKRLRLTDVALAAIDDLDQRAALAMPLHLPMIAPPRPWRRSPTLAQKEAA